MHFYLIFLQNVRILSPFSLIKHALLYKLSSSLYKISWGFQKWHWKIHSIKPWCQNDVKYDCSIFPNFLLFSEKFNFSGYKLSQFRFLLFFMVVYMNFDGLWECKQKLNYLFDVNWRQFLRRMIKKCIFVNFWHNDGHNATFSWFVQWFQLIFVVFEYLKLIFMW